jgi:hypothetical protein
MNEPWQIYNEDGNVAWSFWAAIGWIIVFVAVLSLLLWLTPEPCQPDWLGQGCEGW